MSITNFRNSDIVLSWKCRFQCSVCLQTYDDGESRKWCPYILKCFHNACESCFNLPEYPGFITCKICSVSTNIDSVYDFRKNIEPSCYTRGLLDYKFKTLSYDIMVVGSKSNYFEEPSEMLSGAAKFVGEERVCDECNHEKTKFQCLQCNVPLCSKCYEVIHKYAKALKKHSYVRYEDNELPTYDKKEPVMCKQHKLICNYYCKSCCRVICEECIPNNHSQHQHLVTTLFDENHKYIKEINYLIDIMKNIEAQEVESEKNKRSALATYEKYAVESVKEVSEYFTKLHNILQFSERNILTKIKNSVKTFKRKLDWIECKRNRHINYFKENINCLQQVVKSANEIHLQKVVNSTKSFLNFDETTRSINDSILTYPMNFKSPFICTPILDLEALLKELDPITIKEVEEQNDISVISDTICNENTSKKEVLKDEYDNPFLKSIYNVQKSSTIKTAESVITEPTHPGLIIKSGQVTHFNDPLDFYIQFEEFLNIKKSFFEKCDLDGANNITPTQIEINNIYLIKLNDKNYRRGLIINELEPQTYRVKLIDTGKSMICTKSEIFETSKEILSKPNGANQSSLVGIQPQDTQKWPAEAIDIAHYLLSYEKVVVVIFKSDVTFYVDIICGGKLPISLRTALIFTEMGKQAKVVDQTIKQNVIYYSTHKKKELLKTVISFYSSPVTEMSAHRVKPLHITSPSSFYVYKYESTDEFEDFRFEMNDFYNNNDTRVYCPRNSMKYAVKIEGNWFRCIVDRVDKTLYAEVFLVDKGTHHKVHYTQLRFLDKLHEKIDSYGFECSLIDIEPINSTDWTEEAIFEFKRIMKHTSLKIFIHNITDYQHYVTLTICQKNREINVNTLVVEFGFAISTGFESTYLSKIKVKNENITEDRLSSINLEDSNFNSTYLRGLDDSGAFYSNIKNDLGGSPHSAKVLYAHKEEVIIIHITSPGEFYLQLKKFRAGIKELHDTIQKRQQLLIKDKPKNTAKIDWKIQDDCLVHINLNNMKNKEWFRGIIIEVNNTENDEKSYTVFLRDKGISLKNLKYINLSPISAIDARISNAVIKCHLACLKSTSKDDIWPDNATNAFKNYTNKYENIFATIQGNIKNESIPVVLWGLKSEIVKALEPTVYNFEIINKMIINDGLAELIEAFDGSNQIKINEVANQEDFERKNYINENVDEDKLMSGFQEDDLLNSDDEDENFSHWLPLSFNQTLFAAYPTHIDYNGIIYLHPLTKKNTLKKIKEHINRKTDELFLELEPENVTWKIGDPCIAKYHADSLFYRGEILEILENDNFKVEFVDYGNIEECSRDQLVKKLFFKKVPRLALKYQLYGVEPNSPGGKWNETALDIIHISIIMKLCFIDVKSTPQETIKECSIKVDGYDLAETLIKKGLAKKKDDLGNLRFLSENKVEVTNCIEDTFDFKICEKKEENISKKLSNIKISEQKTKIGDKKSEENDEDDTVNKKKLENSQCSSSNLSDDEEILLQIRLNNTKGNSNQNKLSLEEYYEQLYLENYYHGLRHTNSIGLTDIVETCRISQTKLLLYQGVKKEELKYFDETLDFTKDLFTESNLTHVVDFKGMDHFQFCTLPYGKKEFYGEILFIQNLTYFFVSPIIMETQKIYTEMTIALNEFISSRPVRMKNIEQGQPCLALYSSDKLYYRGLITSVIPDLEIANILYVDFFNTEAVPFGHIYKCPATLLKYPLNLMPIKLHAINLYEHWKDLDIMPFLMQKLNKKVIYFEIITINECIPEAELYESENVRKRILQDLYDKEDFYKLYS